jgi:hypothetical protein
LLYYSDDCYACDSWGDTFALVYCRLTNDQQDWLWATLIMINS